MQKSVDLKNIKIDDFWFNRYIKLISEVVIPYQWKALNDEIEDAEPSFAIRNLKLAAAKLRGEDLYEKFQGFIFQDSDVFKWLEAVAYELSINENEQLERQADYVIDLIATAQMEDGYINSYFILENIDKRWKNLCDCHELYVAGHLIEAAVAYYRSTGKKKILEVAQKFADLLCEVFGKKEGQIPAYPGHEEIELALMKLTEVTSEKRYADLARYFVYARGQDPNYFELERASQDFFAFYPGSENVKVNLSYHQAEAPVLEQSVATGHSVRALYLYAAMVDVAVYFNDEKLLTQCIKLWENVTQHQMYITGGVGQSGVFERFTCSDDLPNDANYAETCANIALVFFSYRLGKATADARYHDIVELELYNAIASGISLDGRRFFYVNPMEVWPENCIAGTFREHVKPVRQSWFACACCPPNLARIYTSLGQYVLTKDILQCTDEEKIESYFINQYIGFNYKDETVKINLTGDYAKAGKISLEIENIEEIELNLRKPNWSRNWQVKLNKKEVSIKEQKIEKGFYKLALEAGHHVIELNFEIVAKFMISRPEVRANRGLLALKRGPLVFALESIDNGENLAALKFNKESSFDLVIDESSNIPYIKAEGFREQFSSWDAEKLYEAVEKTEIYDEKVKLHLVPYAFWGNRGNGVDPEAAGEMRVWLRYS